MPSLACRVWLMLLACIACRRLGTAVLFSTSLLLSHAASQNLGQIMMTLHSIQHKHTDFFATNLIAE
jgi:hypothetical protein